MKYSSLVVALLLWATSNDWEIIQAAPEPPYNEPSTKPLAIYNEFSNTKHGVKSGNLTALSIKELLIPNFSYDGNQSDVYILVGKGKNTSASWVVSSLSSESYNNENLTIHLPSNLTLRDIDWITIWSMNNKSSYGYVALDHALPFPQTLIGFDSIAKSGPVVLVNKKTLYVPNLRFNNEYKDAHFWIGNGTGSDPDPGILLPDENGTTENLRSYCGENIYLRLPDNLTTDDVEYLMIWDKELEKNLGNVSLKDIDNVSTNYGYELQTPEGKTIMRVPKCCPFDSILEHNGCEYNPVTFHPPQIKFLEHNRTHVNTDSLSATNFVIEPYTYNIKCPIGRYPLDSEVEEYALLLNGSLIVRSLALSAVLSQGEYCMETIKDESGNYMKVLVCAPEQEPNKINRAVFNIYIVLNVLSTLCLAGAFCLFYFILKCKTIHKKCFMAYSLFMAITFICLTFAQIGYIESWGCKLLGYVFQFSTICSFTWLAILCFDIFFMIIYFNDDATEGIRLNYYLGVTLGVPVISVLISLRNLTPDIPDSFFKPQFGLNQCFFEESGQRNYAFYIPVFIMIILSFVFLSAAKYKMWQTNETQEFDFFWMENRNSYKYMFRKLCLIVILMSVWMVSAAFIGPTGISDLIEATQGIIIFLLLVSNRDTMVNLNKTFSQWCSVKPRGNNPASNNEYAMEELLPSPSD